MLLAAWRVILLGTVPAVAGSYAVYYALDATDLLPSRLLPVAAAILGGLAFIAFVEALCDGLLSPEKPAWRPAPVSDAAATRLTRLAVGIATVVTVVKSVEALNSGISAALPISIATRGLGAVATALILAVGLHRFADTEQEEEACSASCPPGTTGIGGPARLLGWAAVAVIGLGALVGYVAFAAFLTDQLIWAACVLVLLYLLVQSVDIFIGRALSDETRLATTLQANTGLRKRSLNQISVLATGGTRVVLFLVAALLVLAPWGLNSTDIVSSVRQAFFGFKVGDVTISLSSIAFGIGILVLGVFHHPRRAALAGEHLPAGHRPRRGPAQLDHHGGGLLRLPARARAGLLVSRPEPREAHPGGRRPVGGHRLRPAVDRQQLRLRPAAPVGAPRSGSATRW